MSQVFYTSTGSFGYNNSPYFIKYISADLHLLPKTYLNLNISTTTFKVDNLYYSIGFRFFII